jgi:hypothetical protein
VFANRWVSRTRRGLLAVTPVALIALADLIVQPHRTDLANSEFRRHLFQDVGWAPWNNMWFSGHHTPSYSLVAPAMSAWIGVWSTGVVAAVGTAACGAMLIDRSNAATSPKRLDAAAATLGVCAAAAMISAYTAYLLGTAFGAAALLADRQQRRRSSATVAAGVAATVCALCTPSTAIFLAMVGSGLILPSFCARRLHSAQVGTIASLIVAPTVVTLAVRWAFPTGRLAIPLSVGATINVVAAFVVVAVVVWRRSTTLRHIAITYALLLIATIGGLTGLGHVSARLLTLTAAPLLVMYAPWRNVALAAAGAVMVLYQWSPVAGVAFRDLGPVTERPSFDPVIRIAEQLPAPMRVEVVPTRAHHDADAVPRSVPIARGWQSQLDRIANPLFYDGSLDPDSYRTWLDDRSVAFVAIAAVPLDVGGQAEQRLLADPPDYLQLVYSDELWRVFAVESPQAMVTGPATLTAIDADSFALDVEERSSVVVNVTFSPWFTVTGNACVTSDEAGRTVVTASAAGAVTVRATWGTHGILQRSGSC